MKIEAMYPMETDRWGRELTTHGSLFFPLACYDDDMTFLDVSWHWHEELEVILAVQGTLRVRTSAGTFLLREGEGCFLNTGVPHEVVNAGEGPARLHSLVFHSRLISGSQDSVYWEKYLLPLLRDPERKLLRFLPDISWQKQAMDSIARAWEAAAQEPRGFEFTAREELSRLVLLLTDEITRPRQAYTSRQIRSMERVERMMEFIREHYAREISVAEIARSVALSQSECIRCFRETLGITPFRLVRQVRLGRAMELLAETEEKMESIALQCGFRDVSYFVRAFREEKGCTPGSFRRQCRTLTGCD